MTKYHYLIPCTECGKEELTIFYSTNSMYMKSYKCPGCLGHSGFESNFDHAKGRHPKRAKCCIGGTCTNKDFPL